MGFRVGIIALLQESNTFIPRQTTLDHFRADLLLTGEEVRTRLADTHHEVGGFFAGLAAADIAAVPIFAARAYPYGVISRAAFDELLNLLKQALSAALKGGLDGLLVAPHGATVSEQYPDADGHWLSVVRDLAGSHMPIIGTLDPHANLSPQMVAATDAFFAYRTNPHLDQRAQGLAAAELMARTLRGEVRPVQAAAYPPFAINIERQTTSEPPLCEIYTQADKQLARPGLLGNSILLGFPYADVPEMGSAALAVTDGDRALAEQAARELGRALWDRRADLQGRLVEIEAALDEALTLPGPVCLLDMGDNVGGGSPGDGTLIAQSIQRRQIGPACVCLFDPAAVAQAATAGPGAALDLQIGGRTDDLHGRPLGGRFRVVSLHDGRFEEPQARHGGFRTFDQGRSAVVETQHGLTVLVTSRRVPPFSLQQLTSCGLDPRKFQILVAKGVIAPAAAYAPVCSKLIRVNTPGVTCADLLRLSYRQRRRPMYPFEPDAVWDAE